MQLDHEVRQALADVETQRDDAVGHLAAIKAILQILANGHGAKACAQELAHVVVRQLGVEACAITLRERTSGGLTIAGMATQNERFGGDGAMGADVAWLTLARLVGVGREPSSFRRSPEGNFLQTSMAELQGEGYIVLPFEVGDEAGGAILLRTLVAPATVFGRVQGLPLVAEIVGCVMTVARLRDTTTMLCTQLSQDLGKARHEAASQRDSLRAREEAIERLTAALAASNRVKYDFLGTVSHELRTPLNAILGYATLLREGALGALSADQQSVLDRVLGSSQHLNVLVEDTLFTTQIGADSVLVRSERVPLDPLIDAVIGAIPNRPSHDHVVLRVDVAEGCEEIEGDPGLLRRVLFHLLQNAFKFTAQGDVVLRIEPGDTPSAVDISIRDSGVGITPDKMSAIFELFAQGDGSNTRHHGGLGLGLTLVQQSVRLLGGEVAVASMPGLGTEFRVRLPLARLAPLRDDPAEDGCAAVLAPHDPAPAR